jgi:uncharacterized protein (TIGR03067 family)
MQFRAVAFAVAVMVTGSALSVAAEDGQDDGLVGSWRIVSVEKDGQQVSEDQFKGVVVRYDANGTASGRKGDKVLFEATIKLDPNKRPKALDATQTSDGPGKGKTTLGIYEIEGNTLRTCSAEPGKDRPTEFSAKSGSGHILRVYTREKN